MSKNNKNLFDEIRENWAIIVTIAMIIIGYGNLNSKVIANTEEVADVRSLVERVIILEERERNIESDINEVKLDIKEIKSGLNLHTTGN